MKRTITMIILLAFVVSLSAQNVQTYTVNDVSFKMVLVKGGTFTMGCTSEQGDDCDDDEMPAHQVTLSDFWMGETEVTQALWKTVMGTTVAQQRNKVDPSLSLRGVGSNYPIYYVSYTEAMAFCTKLNNMLSSQLPSGWRFTLPTEAQWEYAARGGKNKSSYRYSGSNSIRSVAWYADNSDSLAHPVKGKNPNALGLYDMTGNVWEWCQDWYSEDYYSMSPTYDPVCKVSGSTRVLRGGSLFNFADGCRVSRRFSYDPDYRNYGFRLTLVKK